MTLFYNERFFMKHIYIYIYIYIYISWHLSSTLLSNGMSKRLERIKKRNVKLREKYKNEIGIISALKNGVLFFQTFAFCDNFSSIHRNWLWSVIVTGKLQAVKLSCPFTVLEWCSIAKELVSLPKNDLSI